MALEIFPGEGETNYPFAAPWLQCFQSEPNLAYKIRLMYYLQTFLCLAFAATNLVRARRPLKNAYDVAIVIKVSHAITQLCIMYNAYYVSGIETQCIMQGSIRQQQKTNASLFVFGAAQFERI